MRKEFGDPGLFQIGLEYGQRLEKMGVTLFLGNKEFGKYKRKSTPEAIIQNMKNYIHWQSALKDPEINALGPLEFRNWMLEENMPGNANERYELITMKMRYVRYFGESLQKYGFFTYIKDDHVYWFVFLQEKMIHEISFSNKFQIEVFQECISWYESNFEVGRYNPYNLP